MSRKQFCHIAISLLSLALLPSRQSNAQPAEQGRYKRLDSDSVYILSLHRGAKLIASLKAFQKATGIKSASVTGVGAVQNTRVSQFRFEGEANMAGDSATSIGQDATVIEGRREIVNLTCILATTNFDIWSGVSPAEPHCHIALAGSDTPSTDNHSGYPAVGGHLFEAEVGVITDLVITTYSTSVKKTFDDNLNGFVIDLSDENGGTVLQY